VSDAVADVVAAVHGRVDHLRAMTGAPPATDDGWHDCDAVTAPVLDAAIAGAGATNGEDRHVAASLLVQSYAHRAGAVSLAAYALGLPWPSPAAAATSVRIAGGRVTGLCFRSGELGPPEDSHGLADALFAGHLVPLVATVRRSQRLGERLLRANVAASCAAAFRAVEGSARDRGDAAERRAVRGRAEAFMGQVPWLAGTGSFDADWGWQRSACCLWFRTSGGRTCEGCSLRPAGGS
jgi:hypothetical protein